MKANLILTIFATLCFSQNIGTAINSFYGAQCNQRDWLGYDWDNGECYEQWIEMRFTGSRKIICNSTHTTFKAYSSKDCTGESQDRVVRNNCEFASMYYCGGKPRGDLGKEGYLYVPYQNRDCSLKFKPVYYSNQTRCLRGIRDGSYLIFNEEDKVKVETYRRIDCRGNYQISHFKYGECGYIDNYGYTLFLDPKTFKINH